MPNNTNVARQENNISHHDHHNVAGVVLVFLVRERGRKEGIKEGLNVD